MLISYILLFISAPSTDSYIISSCCRCQCIWLSGNWAHLWNNWLHIDWNFTPMFVTLARPSVFSSLQITNHSFRYMHHLSRGISSLLRSFNLILFTLLVHLILRISPYHSHYLHSHNLSLPQPFTPDLKLISLTIFFLYSLSVPSGLPLQILNLYRTKWALAFVLF